MRFRNIIDIFGFSYVDEVFNEELIENAIRKCA